MLINDKNMRYKRASITAEASLVFPIFLFVILAFLYFFQIIIIQEKIQWSLTETGRFAACYANILKNEEKNDSTDENQNQLNIAENIISLIFIKEKFLSILKFKNMPNSCIVGGEKGISMDGSNVLDNNDIIYLCASYKVKIPVPFIVIKTLSIKQQIKMRAFTGVILKNEDNDSEKDGIPQNKIVYVTVNGRVYHLNKNCSHIKLQIKRIYFSEIKIYRNEYGGKYKPCESCITKQDFLPVDEIYITTDGDRYHSKISCRGLKRTIRETTLENAKKEGKLLCKRCEGDY